MNPAPHRRIPAGPGLALSAGLSAGLLVACSAPDGQALKKLACEQAASALDMRSLSQMDALRKALGLARDVDPIKACEALGAVMNPPAVPTQPAANGGSPETNPEKPGPSRVERGTALNRAATTKARTTAGGVMARRLRSADHGGYGAHPDTPWRPLP